MRSEKRINDGTCVSRGTLPLCSLLRSWKGNGCSIILQLTLTTESSCCIPICVFLVLRCEHLAPIQVRRCEHLAPVQVRRCWRIVAYQVGIQPDGFCNAPSDSDRTKKSQTGLCLHLAYEQLVVDALPRGAAVSSVLVRPP